MAPHAGFSTRLPARLAEALVRLAGRSGVLLVLDSRRRVPNLAFALDSVRASRINELGAPGSLRTGTRAPLGVRAVGWTVTRSAPQYENDILDLRSDSSDSAPSSSSMEFVTGWSSSGRGSPLRVLMMLQRG